MASMGSGIHGERFVNFMKSIKTMDCFFEYLCIFNLLFLDVTSSRSQKLSRSFLGAKKENETWQVFGMGIHCREMYLYFSMKV